MSFAPSSSSREARRPAARPVLPQLPEQLALQLHVELRAALECLKPLHGALLSVRLSRVEVPLPGVTVTLEVQNGRPYQFWVGLLDGRLCLAATIEAPLSHVKDTLDLDPSKLWSPGWEIGLKETPLASGGKIMVMARLPGIELPEHIDTEQLDPDVLFPALDLARVAQQCLHSQQAARSS